MAEQEGDQPQDEDIKREAHDVDSIGEDFTDGYGIGPGVIHVFRNCDQTGCPTNKYRFELQSEEEKTRGKPVHNHDLKLKEVHVTNKREAERDLRKEFNYPDHRGTEIGWFRADSQEEVLRRSEEQLQKYKCSDTAAE